MDTILSIINEYAMRVYKAKHEYVSHTCDNYYVGSLGLATIYYTVINGKVVDSMVD